MKNLPIYDLNEEQYMQLESSGLGKAIYGLSWPPNISVWRSEKSRYEALLQAFYFVKKFSDASGASASDILDMINDYGDAITDIYKDINSGLITEADQQDIVDQLDGEGDD